MIFVKASRLLLNNKLHHVQSQNSMSPTRIQMMADIYRSQQFYGILTREMHNESHIPLTYINKITRVARVGMQAVWEVSVSLQTRNVYQAV